VLADCLAEANHRFKLTALGPAGETSQGGLAGSAKRVDLHTESLWATDLIDRTDRDHVSSRAARTWSDRFSWRRA
jgi:hypothetical protein